MQSDSPPPTRYASLFRNGRNQAVRIPKEFELDADRVRVSRDGARLILEPVAAHKRLTTVLAELDPIDMEFPDVNAGLPPLDEPGLSRRRSRPLLDTNVISRLIKEPTGVSARRVAAFH